MALALPDAYFTGFRDGLQARRDRLVAGLTDAGFAVLPSEGTYFVTADITPLGGTDGVDFCRSLPERCGVVAVPTQVFYDHQEAGRHLIRFAFCKREDGHRRGRHAPPHPRLTADQRPISGPAAAAHAGRTDRRASWLRTGAAADQAGLAARTSSAMRSATGGPAPRCAASTITRTSGSVPDGRSSTRPVSPSSASASATAACTVGAAAPACPVADRHVDQHLRQLVHHGGQVGQATCR